VRDARRDEIESDLWESEHDTDENDRRHLPARLFARVVLGIPDDLGWRVEQEDPMTASLRVWMVAGISAVVLLGFAGVAWYVTQPPPVPAPPQLLARTAGPLPAPPPPPPPPVPPGTPAVSPPVAYGRTSYTAIGDARPPVRIKDVPPVYPPIAFMSDVQGVVVVEATIDAGGRVSDARVVESIPLFDHCALNAIRQWQFEPASVTGRAALSTIAVTVNFSR
jgi:TonB family protein